MKNLSGNFGDISNVKSYDELPDKAKIYLSRIEEVVGSPIKFIGTGARKRKFDCKIENLEFTLMYIYNIIIGEDLI